MLQVLQRVIAISSAAILFFLTQKKMNGAYFIAIQQLINTVRSNVHQSITNGNQTTSGPFPFRYLVRFLLPTFFFFFFTPHQCNSVMTT